MCLQILPREPKLCESGNRIASLHEEGGIISKKCSVRKKLFKPTNPRWVAYWCFQCTVLCPCMKMVLNINILKAADNNWLYLQAWNLSPAPSMIKLISYSISGLLKIKVLLRCAFRVNLYKNKKRVFQNCNCMSDVGCSFLLSSLFRMKKVFEIYLNIWNQSKIRATWYICWRICFINGAECLRTT